MFKTTLEQWRMLNALIEHGGFAQAAGAVNKSQSTVHHAVHKLEGMLGVKLIKVMGRKAFLTEQGKLLLKRANYLLDETTKIELMAKTLKEGVETYLRIAVDEAFPQEVLIAALSQVSRRYPLMRVELMESILSGSNELLTSNQCDISISPYPLKNCASEELLSIKFIAVANPHHSLFSNSGEVTFEELKSYRQIVVRDSALLQSKSVGWLGSDQRWTVSNMKTSIDLVSQGLGYAWLPEPNITEQLASQSLKKLKLKVGAERTVSFYLNAIDWDNTGIAAKLFCDSIRMSNIF